MSDRSATARVDLALAGLYDRVGARLVYIVYTANVLAGLLTGLVTLAWLTRYLDLRASDAGLVAALIIGVGPPAAGLILWAWRDMFRTAVSWTGDGRTAARAPVVWDSLVRLPHVVAKRALVAACLLMVPLTVLTFWLGADPSWYAAIPFYAATIAALLACGVLWTFGSEFALRPMLRDVAAYLPGDFEPTAGAWRVHAKSLAPLPVVTLFGALTTGAFVDLAPAGGLRLTLALGIALATVLVAGAVFAVVTRSTLDPIDDLLDATRRVRDGDIATPVAIVTADEFGCLASSFNEMLAELRRQRDELRASHVRIVTTADAARRDVERNLHDGAQQRLVLLHLKLGLTAQALRRDPAAADGLVQEMRGDLVLALDELRDLARGLYPPLLENEGLAGALAEMVERAPIAATFECDGPRRFAAQFEAAVYFCCLEALQNAAKHAGDGARATVRLAERDGWLELEIADDGKGFDADRALRGSGLPNMTDRMLALGGRLRIASAVGAGTTVSGTVPIEPPQALPPDLGHVPS